MVVASILLSMGMMMLPPVLISLPFKLMLFVMVDGWYLTVGSLMKSFRLRKIMDQAFIIDFAMDSIKTTYYYPLRCWALG